MSPVFRSPVIDSRSVSSDADGASNRRTNRFGPSVGVWDTQQDMVGGSVRRAVVAGCLFALVVVGASVASPQAAAQQYDASQGALEEVPASAGKGGSVPLRGDGFAPNSTVEVLLVVDASGETMGPGLAAVDDRGILATALALPESLEPGSYTIQASGVAVDGGSRVLSGGFVIEGETAAAELPIVPVSGPSGGAGGMAAVAIPFALVAGLLIIGGLWWQSRFLGS